MTATETRPADLDSLILAVFEKTLAAAAAEHAAHCAKLKAAHDARLAKLAPFGLR